MKRILIVDDEPLVLRLYQEGLAQAGFEVEVAGDGLAAVATLRQRQPDLVVLDLMMPKFTGVDVLKFMRGNAALALVPVIVLSNSFMNALAQEATKVGVQMALLKVSSSPSILAEIIHSLLEGRPLGFDPSKLLAIPEPEEWLASAIVDNAAPEPPPARAATKASDEVTHATPEQPTATDFQTRTRRDFLATASATSADLSKLWQGVLVARNDSERDIQLDNLYRKVHFVAASAGLAHCPNVALLGSAFEAMLFEVVHQPSLLTLSAMRTAANAVDFLGILLERYPGNGTEFTVAGNVLVVDDDAITNRLVVAALHRAHLRTHSTENPVAALKMLQETQFNLLLLDIEMPEMSGLELCKQIRALPAYHDTPVVFVTRHSDFDSRTQVTQSGGNDLIGKPFFALELAVKAVTHLLRSRLVNSPPGC